LFSLEERRQRAWGKSESGLAIPNRACRKAGEDFIWVCSGRSKGNGFKLKEGRFRLDK